MKLDNGPKRQHLAVRSTDSEIPSLQIGVRLFIVAFNCLQAMPLYNKELN